MCCIFTCTCNWNGIASAATFSVNTAMLDTATETEMDGPLYAT